MYRSKRDSGIRRLGSSALLLLDRAVNRSYAFAKSFSKPCVGRDGTSTEWRRQKIILQPPLFYLPLTYLLTMTTKTEKRLSDIEGILRQLAEERAKPSRIRRLWNWGKPYIIPFILGMIVGSAAVSLLPTADSHLPSPSTLEQQAATGGAVIPFPSGKPSPSLLVSPLIGSTKEPSGSSLTSPFEPPSPANPQADNGLTESTRLFRRLTRPTR